MVDNLKSAVLQRPRGELPVFHPRYLELARHFGFTIKPCNVGQGNEKGRVENGVGYVKKNLLNGLEISDLSALNRTAQHWLETVANVRCHGETRQRPLDLWRQEKAHLQPLSEQPFDAALIKPVRATNQFRIHFDANRYSVPAEYLMREQWLRRLLCNELLCSEQVLEPFGRRALRLASSHGQTIQLSLDQTDIGNRFAILMVSVRVGDRALPLAWHVEAGAANIGFAEQQVLLEQVLAWLPSSASVMLSADRFYPSVGLIGWLQQQRWHYRVRLKSNFQADLGRAELTTTGALAQGHPERYETDVMLFASGVLTHVGILHEAGHAEPWIIAMA